MTKNTRSPGISPLSLLLCCQFATLGLLRQTPTYSLFETQIAAYPEASLWLARILSVVVLAAAALAVSRGASLLAHRSLLAIQGAALLAGSAITLYAASSLPFYLAGQTLIGISHAWILACWAERLSSLETTARNRCIAASALIAVLLFAVMGLAPQAARAPLFLIIALGSVAGLLVLPRAGARQPGTRAAARPDATQKATLGRALSHLPAELIVLMASYAMLFRMLVFFDFPVHDEGLFFACASLLRIGGMALLLAYLARKRFKPSIRQIILPLLFLTVVGVALLPAPSAFMSSFSVAIVESSWTFFYTIMWLVLFELGQARGRSSLLVFLCGWTIMNALLLAAAPLASLLNAQVNEGTLSLTALALVIIYMLSVAMLLFRRRPSADPLSLGEGAAAGASWKDGQEAFYRAAARSRGLTKRESEVFELLVQGRSLPAIEEQFVLSHSTVKGHARSIYRKFGVSGKQELIESVNGLRAEEDAR